MNLNIMNQPYLISDHKVNKNQAENYNASPLTVLITCLQTEDLPGFGRLYADTYG